MAEWDVLCGFGADMNVMEVRREEDARALSMLGATPIWGDELQEGYRTDPADRDRIVELISSTVDSVRPSHILFPLGLSHHDHLLVAEASEVVARARKLPNAFVYAERPYAQRRPRVVGQRRHALRASGALLFSERVPRGIHRGDHSAIRCYATQLRGLRMSAFRMGLFRERYWHISWRDEQES
jgi:LmbE family N-acetylglucosaminyl deacetylase